MMAGLSPWLCQGTMPPGSTVSLRMRNLRSLMLAGSFSTSIMAMTVSVTPIGLKSTGAGALGFFWSAGDSAANAAEAMRLDYLRCRQCEPGEQDCACH